MSVITGLANGIANVTNMHCMLLSKTHLSLPYGAVALETSVTPAVTTAVLIAVGDTTTIAAVLLSIMCVLPWTMWATRRGTSSRYIGTSNIEVPTLVNPTMVSPAAALLSGASLAIKRLTPDRQREEGAEQLLSCFSLVAWAVNAACLRAQRHPLQH